MCWFPPSRDERRMGVFATYLLASAPYGTLYCGHTDSLVSRVWKHREKVFSGFTAKYGATRLVWFDWHDGREGAFRRERQIKKWNRAWKIRLIESENPGWQDLYDGLLRPDAPIHPDLVTFIDPITRLPYPARSREGGNPS